MLFTVSLALLGLASLSTAQTYYSPQPLPRPCNGNACVGDYPYNKAVAPAHNSSNQYQDTALIKRGSTYYRFSKGNDTGLGLNVVTAPSLAGIWNYQGTILGGTLKSKCGAFDGQKTSWRWAPEIHFVGGTYYLYFTVEYPGGSQQGTCFDQCVATSPDLVTWTDLGSMNVPPPPQCNSRDAYVRLDGNLAANTSDPSGVATNPPYMVFGSYQCGLYGIPLANMTTVQLGAIPQLVIADQYQTPAQGVSDQSGNYTEGAYQIINGNWIYLFYSRGSCCSAPSESVESVYQTQVCRTALSNGPTGEYSDRDGQSCRTGGTKGWKRTGSTFLYSNDATSTKASVYQPGSVGVFNDVGSEGLVMWYQYQDNTGASGKRVNLGFGYNYLTFGSDAWPTLVAGNHG